VIFLIKNYTVIFEHMHAQRILYFYSSAYFGDVGGVANEGKWVYCWDRDEVSDSSIVR
jgi:hypothetical protein